MFVPNKFYCDYCTFSVMLCVCVLHYSLCSVLKVRIFRLAVSFPTPCESALVIIVDTHSAIHITLSFSYLTMCKLGESRILAFAFLSFSWYIVYTLSLWMWRSWGDRLSFLWEGLGMERCCLYLHYEYIFHCLLLICFSWSKVLVVPYWLSLILYFIVEEILMFESIFFVLVIGSIWLRKMLNFVRETPLC